MARSGQWTSISPAGGSVRIQSGAPIWARMQMSAPWAAKAAAWSAKALVRGAISAGEQAPARISTTGRPAWASNE